jgi:hypothetical protein
MGVVITGRDVAMRHCPKAVTDKAAWLAGWYAREDHWNNLSTKDEDDYDIIEKKADDLYKIVYTLINENPGITDKYMPHEDPSMNAMTIRNHILIAADRMKVRKLTHYEQLELF